ncbi:hypothetical protein P7K49_024629, partial [Saguinus oedipus]
MLITGRNGHTSDLPYPSAHSLKELERTSTLEDSKAGAPCTGLSHHRAAPSDYTGQASCHQLIATAQRAEKGPPCLRKRKHRTETTETPSMGVQSPPSPSSAT